MPARGRDRPPQVLTSSSQLEPTLTVMDTRTRTKPAVAVVVALVVGVSLLGGCTPHGATLNRPEEPVVLTGDGLPRLVGSAPMRVVGFAWDGDSWHQVPVQVDQRDWVNYGQVYNRPPERWAKLQDGTPWLSLSYTAPTTASPGYRWWDTYTPPDRNPNLDADDEVVFMADDTGKAAPASAGHPAAVVTSTRQRVTVTDPLDPDQVGDLYLYRSTTLTGGGAGTTGVDYRFSLDTGDYKKTYGMGAVSMAPNNGRGPNPEHSTVTAPGYGLTFGDRWLNDGLSITNDGVTSPSGLERAMIRTSSTSCVRSEDTFNGLTNDIYEGAFIANISGPVRAIRSYIGANSGYYTAATDLFYADRHDIVSELRLHEGPGVMTFDDLRTGVAGLSYHDDHTGPGGVRVDGRPDAVGAAPPAWQMITGDLGSLITTRSIDTDIPELEVSTYYKDQSPATPKPCTGDGSAWGQHGIRVTGPDGGQTPCTDPTRYPNGPRGNCPPIPGRDEPYFATATRHRLFGAPNLAPAQAASLAAHIETPLTTTVSP